MSTRWHQVVIVLVGLFWIQVGMAQDHFTAKFSAAQETHSVTSSATGTASCVLTDEGLWFYVTVEGLSGPITAAHFHNAPMGQDGGVVRTITGDFDGNTATGLWTPTDGEPLTDALIKELFAGNLYLNIHTAANPPGEIRAQIISSDGIGLSARLTPDQLPDTINSSASGTASLKITDAGVAFKLTVDGLSGPITAAHFHRGAMGQSGPVVRTITSEFTGNTAVGLWTSNDSEPLTDALVQDLITGNLYFNVHTAMYPAGEIRGQILLTGGWGFTAQLDTAQQPHPVTNNATGTAALTFTNEGLVFKITVEGLSGPITAVHFHNGPAGSNGPVVRTITSEFGGGNTAIGVWSMDDAEPLTDALIQELISGNIYINVHTAANPMGEVRGQVLLNTATGLATEITAAQETHSSSGTGTGTGNFTLTNAGLEFHITVEGLSGPITAAHFHNAPPGLDGGVVRTITSDFTGNTASGVWTAGDGEPLTDQLIQELLAGNIYVNVHTAANPPGEIRGQVLLNAGSDITSRLTPEQEVHSVTSNAVGSAAVTLTDAGVLFNVTVEGLSGNITAAHFHHGAAGENGGVVRTITGDFNGNTATGLWTANDSEPLTDSLRAALLAGDLYFNIHTAANPMGEVRGQVFLSSGVGLTSRLDADQEVHTVTSDAMGSSALTLNEAGLVFNVTIEGLSGPITAAHFHNGPFGQNGPVVRTITPDFSGNTAFGVWTDNDAEPLTPALINELISRNIYYNIHTAANPMGEIRGQLEFDVITAIEPIDNGVIPEVFSLSQNYPNPFNPSTTIEFNLPRAAFTSLTVYNVLGQKVATILGERLTAGSYKFTFDAGNLASGIYFYRLDAGDFHKTRQMLLIK